MQHFQAKLHQVDCRPFLFYLNRSGNEGPFLLPYLFQQGNIVMRVMTRMNRIVSSHRFWIRKQLTKVMSEKVLVNSTFYGQLSMVWGSKINAAPFQCSLLSLKGWLETNMYLLQLCQRASIDGWWRRVLFFGDWHMLPRTQDSTKPECLSL